jgi:hypothetical protein
MEDRHLAGLSLAVLESFGCTHGSIVSWVARGRRQAAAVKDRPGGHSSSERGV